MADPIAKDDKPWAVYCRPNDKEEFARAEAAGEQVEIHVMPRYHDKPRHWLAPDCWCTPEVQRCSTTGTLYTHRSVQ